MHAEDAIRRTLVAVYFDAVMLADPRRRCGGWRGHVGQGHARQHVRIINSRLTVAQCRAELDERRAPGLVHAAGQGLQVCAFQRCVALGLICVGHHGHAHTVGVVQQQAGDQPRNVSRRADFTSQSVQYTVKFQQFGRIAAIHGGRHHPPHELQAKGIAATANVTLRHLDAIKHRVQGRRVDTFARDFGQHREDTLLKRRSVLGSTALDTTYEHQLTRRIIHAAQFRRRVGELGGLQVMTQW